MIFNPLIHALAGARLRLADAAPVRFRLTSPDFVPGGTIADEQAYDGFGCTGGNLSPALEWSGAPPDTRSFALLVHDPDAPTGGAGWWHWLVIDIPAGTSGLPKGAGGTGGSRLPGGASSLATDYGMPGYGGPCPPVGDRPHRYNFTLYALKVATLELPKGATAALAGYLVNANAIGKATLTGTYGRAR